jgi:hypothetical protein
MLAFTVVCVVEGGLAGLECKLVGDLTYEPRPTKLISMLSFRHAQGEHTRCMMSRLFTLVAERWLTHMHGGWWGRFSWTLVLPIHLLFSAA